MQLQLEPREMITVNSNGVEIQIRGTVEHGVEISLSGGDNGIAIEKLRNSYRWDARYHLVPLYKSGFDRT